jgi:hypothetical protein
MKYLANFQLYLFKNYWGPLPVPSHPKIEIWYPSSPHLPGRAPYSKTNNLKYHRGYFNKISQSTYTPRSVSCDFDVVSFHMPVHKCLPSRGLGSAAGGCLVQWSSQFCPHQHCGMIVQ